MCTASQSVWFGKEFRATPTRILLPELDFFNFGPPQAENFDILVLLLRDLTLKMRKIALSYQYFSRI